MHTKSEKKESLKNRRNTNRHKKKTLDESELYLIPNLNNIIDLIYKIHVSILHQSFIKMKDKINELKIFIMVLIMI